MEGIRGLPWLFSKGQQRSSASWCLIYQWYRNGWPLGIYRFRTPPSRRQSTQTSWAVKARIWQWLKTKQNTLKKSKETVLLLLLPLLSLSPAYCSVFWPSPVSIVFTKHKRKTCTHERKWLWKLHLLAQHCCSFSNSFYSPTDTTIEMNRSPTWAASEEVRRSQHPQARTIQPWKSLVIGVYIMNIKHRYKFEYEYKHIYISANAFA